MNSKTRKELILFFVIAFAFAWLVWLPGVLIPNFPITGKVLEVIGALGPALAALILVGRSEGKAGLKRIAANSFGKKCNWKFLIWSSLLLMGIHAASRLIYGLFSSNLPESDMLTSPLSIVPLFIVMFLLGGGLNEEIGWRGYALDRFQGKYSALVSSLFLGVFWIIWHLPVFFLPGTNQSLIPLLAFHPYGHSSGCDDDLGFTTIPIKASLRRPFFIRSAILHMNFSVLCLPKPARP